jgi:hypothetical protein
MWGLYDAHVGDLASSDELLLSLHDPSQLLSGASVGIQILDKLNAQERLVNERLAGLVAINTTQNEEVSAKLASLTLERRSLDTQAQITQQRISWRKTKWLVWTLWHRPMWLLALRWMRLVLWKFSEVVQAPHH